MQYVQEDSSHGFTLIEIIGVLAVMSILAATIAPSAIQMITSSKQTSEDKALAAIADAMRLYVQTNKKVPAEVAANPIAAVASTTSVDAWDKAIGTIMNVPATKVSTNTINKKRIYLYPADFITASAPNPLPYDQQAELTNLNGGGGVLVTSKPDPRVMVISNMNPSVTLATASGQLATADFDAIWNQTAIPTAYAELTEGDKLKIARINMTDLFVAVDFNQLDTTYNTAIQVDALPTTPYTLAIGSSILTPYLIKGSQIALYDGFLPTGNAATIYSKQIVQQSNSLYFSGNIWGNTQGAAGGGGTGGKGIGSTSASPLGNLVNPSGMLKTSSLKAKSNCNRTTSAGLTVDASQAQDDYFVFEGDRNGNIIAWDKASKGKITFFGSTNQPTTTANGSTINKYRNQGKQGNTNFNDIQTCDVVLVVPSNNPSGNISFFIFYMPETQTATPYEVTIP